MVEGKIFCSGNPPTLLKPVKIYTATAARGPENDYEDRGKQNEFVYFLQVASYFFVSEMETFQGHDGLLCPHSVRWIWRIQYVSVV